MGSPRPSDHPDMAANVLPPALDPDAVDPAGAAAAAVAAHLAADDPHPQYARVDGAAFTGGVTAGAVTVDTDVAVNNMVSAGSVAAGSADFGGGTVVVRVDPDDGPTTLGFFGVTPVTRPAALTPADAAPPNTGDAATDALVANLRTRLNELAARLQALGLLS